MIGMAYGNFQLIVNIVLLIIEIAFGRRFLGIGTVVNAVCLAYITTFFIIFIRECLDWSLQLCRFDWWHCALVL